MENISIRIWGRVQGVGFRYFTKRLADHLKIKGTVQNKLDGSVYIIAQSSSKEKLERFTQKVKESPSPYGKVNKIEILTLEQEVTYYEDFLIVH